MTVNKYGRTVGARLKEEELAKLNDVLFNNNLKSIGELLKGIVKGQVTITRQQFVNNKVSCMRDAGVSTHTQKCRAFEPAQLAWE
ncbi:MAG: hypothetical protein V3T40_01855, partial [Nitrososphaerales archaeon]